MFSPWLFSGIIGAALLVLCGIAYLVGVGIRTQSLAKCWRCGAAKVRASISRSPVDLLAAVFFLQPYRCTGCRARFYAFRTLPAKPALVPKHTFPRVKVIIRLPTFAAWKRSWKEGFESPSESLR